MRERIKHMLIKEFIQIFRDPRMKGVIFLMPIIQLFVFGYAVMTDVKNIPTLVFDLDHSVASRELISRFVKSGYFDVVEYTDPVSALVESRTEEIEAARRMKAQHLEPDDPSRVERALMAIR